MSLALLETAADPARPWTFAFIGITFAAYLLIGWRSRVRETRGFYVAGQGVPAIANGAATAADWMSAASFIGMAGLISVKGSDGSMYLMGWTGGIGRCFEEDERHVHSSTPCLRSSLSAQTA